MGDGIRPSSLIEDAKLHDQVQRLWLAWTDEADADGLTDFYGLQAMVAREMFVAGECFENGSAKVGHGSGVIISLRAT